MRSYPSARGKVNKGIKTTVMSEPERFLAYNNGITATATDVQLSSDGSILSLTDLQIVNGGQTSASLFYVNRDEREPRQMTDVDVQAKIVVVSPDKARELLPSISRFANSQNKVSEADFFSNSPFHVRVEELSAVPSHRLARESRSRTSGSTSARGASTSTRRTSSRPASRKSSRLPSRAPR